MSERIEGTELISVSDLNAGDFVQTYAGGDWLWLRTAPDLVGGNPDFHLRGIDTSGRVVIRNYHDADIRAKRSDNPPAPFRPDALRRKIERIEDRIEGLRYQADRLRQSIDRL